MTRKQRAEKHSLLAMLQCLNMCDWMCVYVYVCVGWKVFLCGGGSTCLSRRKKFIVESKRIAYEKWKYNKEREKRKEKDCVNNWIERSSNQPTTFEESEYTYLRLLFIQSMLWIGIGNTWNR